MIDALLISNVVLWLLVIGLALTVLALTRQIGLLHERISLVGARLWRRATATGHIFYLPATKMRSVQSPA